MESSISTLLKPTESARNQQQQQLTSNMLEATHALMAKRVRDPTSLTVAELKTLLRAEGKPVSGLKADLLARLLNDNGNPFFIDEDKAKDPLPPRNMTPSVSHPLRIIPFDGNGSDPALLVGRRIQRFQPDRLMYLDIILHTDQGLAMITFSDYHNRHGQIAADEALLEGLKSVERVKGEEANRAERETEAREAVGLLIVEAAVGLRKCPGMGEYRVVGLRCEGMKEMGFVFSEDVVLDDYHDGTPRFEDVVLKFR